MEAIDQIEVIKRLWQGIWYIRYYKFSFLRKTNIFWIWIQKNSGFLEQKAPKYYIYKKLFLYRSCRMINIVSMAEAKSQIILLHWADN